MASDKKSDYLSIVTEPLRLFRWKVFAWGVFAATTGHWLALSSLHVLTESLEIPESSLLLSLLSLVLMFGVAILLYHLHHKNPWPRGIVAVTVHLGLAWAVFAAGLWFAVTMEKVLISWIRSLEISPYGFLVLVGMLGVIIFAPRYGKLRDEFQGVRNIERQQHNEKIDSDTLILFVSTPSIVPEVMSTPEKTGKRCHAQVRFGSSLTASLEGVSLVDDIATITAVAAHQRPWNWQQILRSIAPFENLRSIWLIGSTDAVKPDDSENADSEERSDVDYPESLTGAMFTAQSGKGSFDFLPLCGDLIAPYTSAEINIYSNSLDFGDFAAMFDAVNMLLRGKLAEIPPERIMVDVTGGTKITSIVAAMLTQNRGTRFQYVETQPDFGVVRYRLVNEQPPSPQGRVRLVFLYYCLLSERRLDARRAIHWPERRSPALRSLVRTASVAWIEPIMPIRMMNKTHIYGNWACAHSAKIRLRGFIKARGST